MVPSEHRKKLCRDVPVVRGAGLRPHPTRAHTTNCGERCECRIARAEALRAERDVELPLVGEVENVRATLLCDDRDDLCLGELCEVTPLVAVLPDDVAGVGLFSLHQKHRDRENPTGTRGAGGLLDAAWCRRSPRVLSPDEKPLHERSVTRSNEGHMVERHSPM